MDHPARKFGMSAERAFDLIGVGPPKDLGHPKSAIAKLLEAGMIRETGERVICQDRFGTVRVMGYALAPEWIEPWTAYWLTQSVDSEATP